MAAQLILMKGKPSAEFELFWGNYPRKVGRIPAARLWNRMRPPLDEVLEGIKAWTGSREWEDPHFIPHATTFLSQERWRERPVQTAAKGKTLYQLLNGE